MFVFCSLNCILSFLKLVCLQGFLKKKGANDKLFTFQGVCGGQVYLYDGNKTPASKKLLIDVGAQQLSDITYLPVRPFVARYVRVLSLFYAGRTIRAPLVSNGVG